MHRILPLVPLLLSGSAAAATTPADRVTWALCLSGEGCQVCDTSLTHAQVDQTLAALGLISGNPGYIVTTMRKQDGEWSWYYDTRRSPAELDRYFGGSGRGKLATCPTMPGAIQPRDGTWRVTADASRATGCPAGLEKQLPALQMMKSGRVVFGKPFHASEALPDPAVTWVQLAPDRHAGSFVPAGTRGMQARYTLDVESPERMRGHLVVSVPIPGRTTCRVETPFTYERTGD